MSWCRRQFLRGVSAVGTTYALHFPALPVRFANGKLSPEAIAADPLRPQFHLLPPRNWMNDPNGPIFWNGQYHMFYQFNPGATVWGDMHWAHAVSPDMVHWKHLPIALAPTSRGPDQDGCFSGSAVTDSDTVTVIYTGVQSVAPAEATLRDGRHNFLETQCLATSRDPQLLTWKKRDEPVLLPPHDPHLTGFRDPCLWRERDTWYMGVGSGQRGVGGCVLLYRSRDLHKWEYVSRMASGKGNGKQTLDFVDSGEMWECPDFFPLGPKHVLLYSTERKVFWQTGEFDRRYWVFHPEQQGALDAGAFYAPKSQLDAKGRRILWGWIPETRPEAEFSVAGWAGCMSLPRVLTLKSDNTLSMEYLPELAQLRGGSFSIAERSSETATLRREALRSFVLAEPAAALECRTSQKPFELSLVSANDPWLTLSFDPSRAGEEFRVNERAVAIPQSPSHSIQVMIDASVVECIVDHTIAVTTRVYKLAGGSLHFNMRDAELNAIDSLHIFLMKAISPGRLTA